MGPSQAIREARERAAMSQRKLAAVAGVAHQTVGNIETGKTKPNGATLTALSRAMKFESYEALLQSVGEKPFSSNWTNAIPILGSIEAGFRDHESVEDSDVMGSLPRIGAMGVDDPAAFAVVVEGQSMIPELMPGELAICSPAAAMRGFVNGQIYALRLGSMHDHECTIKRVEFAKGDDGVDLVPSNPRHESRKVLLENIDRAALVVGQYRSRELD